MASKNAELVAKDVIQTIRNGKKINLGKIIKNRGYSHYVSKAPSVVTRTKSYKSAIKSTVEMLKDEIARIQAELLTRNLSTEEYTDLTRSLDLLVKNAQLLGGKATENRMIILPSEIVNKNGLDKQE